MNNQANDFEDKQQLLKIFPAEIWHYILSKRHVTDASERNAITRASPYFRQVLSDTGATWNILYSDIWKVDGYQYYPTVNVGDSVVERELVTFISREKNPEMESFMKSHGQQIWYCTLGISVKIQTKVECYQKLRWILNLLPNLKGLRVQYGHIEIGTDTKTSPNGYGYPDRPTLALYQNKDWLGGLVGMTVDMSYGNTAPHTSDVTPPISNKTGNSKRYLHNLENDGKGLQEVLQKSSLPALEQLNFLNLTDVPDFIKQVLTSDYGSKVTLKVDSNRDVEWTNYYSSNLLKNSNRVAEEFKRRRKVGRTYQRK